MSKYCTIEAHAYDIDIFENESPDGDLRSEMRLWCMNRKNEPCLLRVRDFPVFCKVELPRLKDNSGDPITWDDQRLMELINVMNKRLENKDCPPIRDWEYKKLKKLYYYTPSKKKFPFLILIFDTINHMYQVSKLCKKLYTPRYGPLTLNFYEMNIPLYNKMFSLQKLSMTDKFTCKAKEILPGDPERISKVGPGPSKYNKGREFKEYQIKWETMKASKDVWFSYPIICSFDIESYSHNHRVFPQKHDDEDIIFSISVTISKYMNIDKRKDYIIIIGDTLPAEEIECDSPNLIIVNVENEAQVLKKFFEIINYEDPDIFIGYNIYGFDFDYMDARILDTGDEWPNLSRLVDGKFEIKNLTWSSSGRGANKMFLPYCSGRISFDMYKIVQMDYKLSVYSLEAVSMKFLKQGKDDLKYYEMFQIHEKVARKIKKKKKLSEKLLKLNSLIVKYNVQDSLLVTKLFEKLNVWVSVVELSSVVRVLPIHYCTRGQQMRCKAQIYHAASWKDIVLSTIEIEYGYFEGGYVAKPKKGYWPLIACFDFNSLYPSIIIAYNLCYTTLVKDIDKHIEKYGEESIHIFDFEQEEPAGWKPPKRDKFDYSGYRNSSSEEEEEEEEEEEKKKDKRRKKKKVKKVKKHYRIGFVKKEFYKGFIPEIEENLLSNRGAVKKDLKKLKEEVKTINKKLFGQLRENKNLKLEDITDDVIIKFLEKCKIIDPDVNLNDQLKKINRFFEANQLVMLGFLDARQKGLKICANSLYGYFGATTNDIYLIQASNVITYMGRTLIIEAGHFFEKHYDAEVVYGDTDSTMVNIPQAENDPTKIWKIAEVMEKHINGKLHKYDKDGNIIEKGKSIFLPPLYLEAEKMMRAIFMKKKHYVYFEYDKNGSIICEDGTNIPLLESKGILIARRDNCKWTRFIYKDIIMSVFEDATPIDIFKKIVNIILEVIDVDYESIPDKFSIVKGMNSNYKSKTTSMYVFGEEMKALKRPIQPGERVKYVVVRDHKGRERVSEKMRTIDLFQECWESSGLEYGEPVSEDYEPEEGLYPPEELDPIYYIEKQLMEPIDRLFECVFFRIIEPYTKVGFKPQKNKRLGKATADTPVKMIVQMIKDNKKAISVKGVKCMTKTIRSLPEWYSKIR